MRNGLLYFLVFAIGIFCCWYFMRGCDRPDEKTENTIKVLSAANDSFYISSQKLGRKYDSIIIAKVIGDSAYEHKIDSQSHVIAVLKGKFNVTKDSIGVLYRNLKTFYLDHDTVALAETYQRLSDQLQSANQQLFAIQIQRDSADNIRDAEITRLQGVISQLQAEIVELKQLLTACTSNASELAKTGLKAIKRAKISALISKIGVGLSAVLAVILLSNK
jgi:hypothetical protein